LALFYCETEFFVSESGKVVGQVRIGYACGVRLVFVHFDFDSCFCDLFDLIPEGLGTEECCFSGQNLFQWVDFICFYEVEEIRFVQDEGVDS